jgi:hypothetical protein
MSLLDLLYQLLGIRTSDGGIKAEDDWETPVA